MHKIKKMNKKSRIAQLRFIGKELKFHSILKRSTQSDLI